MDDIEKDLTSPEDQEEGVEVEEVEVEEEKVEEEEEEEEVEEDEVDDIHKHRYQLRRSMRGEALIIDRKGREEQKERRGEEKRGEERRRKEKRRVEKKGEEKRGVEKKGEEKIGEDRRSQCKDIGRENTATATLQSTKTPRLPSCCILECQERGRGEK